MDATATAAAAYVTDKLNLTDREIKALISGEEEYIGEYVTKGAVQWGGMHISRRGTICITVGRGIQNRRRQRGVERSWT